MNKTYLGDSVYCQEDASGGIKLTTENGIVASNTIILEPHVLQNLFEYLQSQLDLAIDLNWTPRI